MNNQASRIATEWIFIEAHDVWMFRDSKPFIAQQSFVARSQFPPNPQTMQGILRSHWLEQNSVDYAAYARHAVSANVRTAVGLPGWQDRPPELGAFQMAGPFMARRTANGSVERLFRAPLDVVGVDDPGQGNRPKQFRLLQPLSKATFETEPPFDGWRPLGLPNGSRPAEASGWLGETAFVASMAGKPPTEGDFIRPSDIFERDPRIGLGLDAGKRVAAESLLYHAEFVRPAANVGLLVQVPKGFFGEVPNGVLNIGGESRSGYYTRVQYSPLQVAQSPGIRLKVTLLTPAYFGDGWKPINADWSPWLGPQARLVSMTLGRPQLISGWDIARGKAKPLRHYIPAGSVYFFEGANPTGKPFTETPEGELDFGAIGFGNIAIGTWNYV